MKMNYLKEIVTFDSWAEENSLSNPAQLLWYKLMGLCNKLLWPEWFAIDNMRLAAKLGASKETFVKARKELVAVGRIEVRTGKKGSPSQYRIIPFAPKSNFFAKNKTENKGEKAPYINKQEKLKKRDAIASLEKDGAAKETVTEKEQQNTQIQSVHDLYNQICVSFPHLDKLSFFQKRAIKARLKNGYTAEDFKKLFKNAEDSAFLKGSGASGWRASFDWLLRRENMVKVLAGSYAVLYGVGARERKPKPNGFCNFEQRETNYDALVMQSVLAWANA